MSSSARESEVLLGVEKQVRQIFEYPGVDPVHDILHVMTVVRYTDLICQGENIDPFVPKLAAWLHDVGRIDEIKARQEGRRLPHAPASAVQVPSLLKGYNLDYSVVTIIQDAVSRHSDLNKEDDSWVAICLKDADRLAGWGANGLFRCAAESGIYGRRLINLDDPFPNGPFTLSRLRSPATSHVEALLFTAEWQGMFRLETAKELSKPLAGRMARNLWWIACETGTEEACTRNAIFQALIVNASDVQEEIRQFRVISR